MRRSKRFWIVVTLAVTLIASIVLYGLLRPQQSEQGSVKQKIILKQFEDKQIGAAFSLDAAYQQRALTQDHPSSLQKKALPPKNFERTNPQSLISIRYETGLKAPANLLKRSLIEHIESETRQYFKVKYKNYQPVSMIRTKVASFEALEHIYKYSDSDGNPVQVRLLAIPYDSDSAYYLILQTHESHFDSVNNDLTPIIDTIKFNGPQI